MLTHREGFHWAGDHEAGRSQLLAALAAVAAVATRPAFVERQAHAGLPDGAGRARPQDQSPIRYFTRTESFLRSATTRNGVVTSTVEAPSAAIVSRTKAAEMWPGLT